MRKSQAAIQNIDSLIMSKEPDTFELNHSIEINKFKSRSKRKLFIRRGLQVLSLHELLQLFHQTHIWLNTEGTRSLVCSSIHKVS